MRQVLAEKLLIKIMNWDFDKVRSEQPMLQAISDFKYDEYRQFSPGMLFLGSFTRWLSQFDPKDRDVAYEFIKKNLIFISENQIRHLVSLGYAQIVDPIIIKKTSIELNLEPYELSKIINSSQYLRNQRETLYIGMSDGSRIDYFRRASGLNNEQVFSTYYISQEKTADLKKELVKDGHENFNSIFLIDDFTASGKSYFRRGEKNEYKGKVFKFLDFLINPDSYKEVSLDTIIDIQNLTINVIFYLATDQAIEYLKTEISNWLIDTKQNIKVSIHVIQPIPSSIKESVLNNKEFISLTKKYFDQSVIDEHYVKGKTDNPNLGFNECSLPLVLNHNTPNNSLPLLWFPEDKLYKGLFPRITRHI